MEALKQLVHRLHFQQARLFRIEHPETGIDVYKIRVPPHQLQAKAVERRDRSLAQEEELSFGPGISRIRRLGEGKMQALPHLARRGLSKGDHQQAVDIDRVVLV